MHGQTGFLWYGSEAAAHDYVKHLQACWDKWQTIGAFSDDDDDDSEFQGYGNLITLYDDVAVLSVSGSLGYKETVFSRYFGMPTYEGIANATAAVVADGRAKTLVLDIDSPGGLARGTSVASDALKAAAKAGLKVVSHTSGDMLSAAYWVGSAAEKVSASKTAEVGSVGVILVHQEISGMLKEMGITATVFRKGDEKALGTPFEPLDDKSRASIDRRLEAAYGHFVDAVAEFRGLSSDFVRSSVATGRVFSAGEALQLGLIDSIETFNDLMNSLTPPKTAQSHAGAMQMSKTPILHAVAPPGVAALEAGASGPEEFDVLVNALAGVPEPKADDEPAEEKVTEGHSEEAAPEQAEPAPAPAASSGVNELLTALNTQLVTAQVELEKTKAERDDLRASNAGLRQIVVEQTENLRIRLGMPAGSDLSTMSDTTLVATHQAVRADFLARFKPGPVSVAPATDTKLPGAVVTRLDQAVRHATSIK